MRVKYTYDTVKGKFDIVEDAGVIFTPRLEDVPRVLGRLIAHLVERNVIDLEAAVDITELYELANMEIVDDH
jgi:hypothetical protein